MLTIPEAALIAAAKELCDADGESHEHSNYYISVARAACLAMLQNWPGVRLGKYRDVAGPNDRIILPLPPQEGE